MDIEMSQVSIGLKETQIQLGVALAVHLGASWSELKGCDRVGC
jgi:hypothetical protein